MAELTESLASLFDNALERYQAGESPESLIPVFKDICDQSPKYGGAWSCLAWLYLLTDEPQKALKAAQKGVKFDPKAPQARINLSLAMLATKQKGVREHIEYVQQLMALESEIRDSITENIADGLERKPDWKELQKIKNWLNE